MGFLENSSVSVRGSLDVARSILHSRVRCGGVLRVRDHLVGGEISAWEGIEAKDVGLEQGQPTRIRVGADYHEDKKREVLSKRLQRISLAWDESLKSIRLLEKREALLQKNQKELLIQLRRRSLRLEDIKNKLHHALEKAEKVQKWNENASLIVSGRIDRSTEVQAMGRRVSIETDLAGVIVTPFASKGIAGLEQLNDLLQIHPDLYVSSGVA